MPSLSKLILLVVMLCTLVSGISAQQKEVVIPIKGNTVWWSGISNHGEMLPMTNGYSANLDDNYGNQVQPLLISNTGEIVWSEEPFKLFVKNNILTVTSSTPSCILTKVLKK